MRNELRREVDVHIAHGDDTRAIREASADFDIGQRAIPGQVDLATDKRLNQGIVVRIQHPVEGHIHTVEMLFNPFKDGYDVGCIANRPDLQHRLPPQSASPARDYGCSTDSAGLQGSTPSHSCLTGLGKNRTVERD